MKENIKWMFIVCMLVAISLSLTYFVFGDAIGNLYREDIYKTHDGYVFDWYNVENWEKEFCEKEAGVSSETEEYSVTGLGNDEKRTYSLSLTLQAQYRTLENGTLYEVAWYIQPFNTDIEYEIYTSTAEGVKTTVQERAKSSAKTGDANYWSTISDKNFTKVFLKYLGPEGEKIREFNYVAK